MQLDFTVGGIKPISEGHSLISLCRGPIQIFVRRGPIQIAENRAACGGCGSLAARAADTYRQKSLHCRKKRHLRRISEVQPDLRGSLIVPRIVKSNCAGPARGGRAGAGGGPRPAGRGRGKQWAIVRCTSYNRLSCKPSYPSWFSAS